MERPLATKGVSSTTDISLSANEIVTINMLMLAGLGVGLSRPNLRHKDTSSTMSSHTSMIPIKPIMIEPSGNDDPWMSTSSPPSMPLGSDLTILYNDNGGVPPNRDDQPHGLQIIELQADVESGDTPNPKSLESYATHTESENLQAPHTSQASVMVSIPLPSTCSMSEPDLPAPHMQSDPSSMTQVLQVPSTDTMVSTSDHIPSVSNHTVNDHY